MPYFELPEHRGRSPEEIMTDKVVFDSVGFLYRGISWLDRARRRSDPLALFYAALEVRHGIEQLFFEEIVLSVGGELDRTAYAKCKGNSSKLYKIVKRLNPDYEKLTAFTQAVFSEDPSAPPLIDWDFKELMRMYGKVSNYLHWDGEPAETWESEDWLNQGIEDVSEVADRILAKEKSGYRGVMLPKDMAPEIENLWSKFRRGEIDVAAVQRSARLALPVLEGRLRRT